MSAARQQLVEQRQTVPGHPRAGLGVLPVQRPRRGERRRRGRLLVTAVGQRGLVSGLRPADTGREVHRGGTGTGEVPGRVPHVEAAHGGEGDAVRAA